VNSREPSTKDNSAGAGISMHDVQRRFGPNFNVVERLNLEISSGDFISLLGPSGCGKSTLLRLIADLDKADSGRIEINAFGRSFFRGFVFQDAHLLPWTDVLNNVALPLRLMGRSKSEALTSAKEALDRVGLADALKKYPAELSGGMKMRASVARALVAQPSLLLLDEPFAALDENTRHRLQEELRLVWQRAKMTVVFVTHSVTEAVYLSNRAIVLSKRPARVLLDTRIDLPEMRPKKIRTEPEFIKQINLIYEAFEAGDGEGV
jgi:NitT/TauT family transport system ATP-binding protein